MREQDRGPALGGTRVGPPRGLRCVSPLTPRSPGDERTIESPFRREQKLKEKLLLLLRSTPTQKRCQHLGCLIIPNCFHRSSSLLHTESARPPRVPSWVSSCYLIKPKQIAAFSPRPSVLCSAPCSICSSFVAFCSNPPV